MLRFEFVTVIAGYEVIMFSCVMCFTNIDVAISMLIYSSLELKTIKNNNINMERDIIKPLNLSTG